MSDLAYNRKTGLESKYDPRVYIQARLNCANSELECAQRERVGFRHNPLNYSDADISNLEFLKMHLESILGIMLENEHEWMLSYEEK